MNILSLNFLCLIPQIDGSNIMLHAHSFFPQLLNVRLDMISTVCPRLLVHLNIGNTLMK